MRDYDAVIFDMDGVIFDSERAVMNCWLELAEKYRIENIRQPYFACVGTTMKRTREIMLETYGPDFPMIPMRRRLLFAIMRNMMGDVCL